MSRWGMVWRNRCNLRNLWIRREVLLRGLQAGEDLAGFSVPDANDLPAGRLAPEHENAGLGKIEPGGKEGPAGGVGRPFHGRRGESQGYSIRQLGHQQILRSPRLHMDGEEDIRAILSDNGRVGSHFGVAGLSGMAASKRS